MRELIYYIFFNLLTLIIIISFLLSFRLRNKENTPLYLKSFFWYPLIAIIDSITYDLAFLDYIPRIIPITFNNITLIFSYSFLSFFIIKRVIEKRKMKYL